MGEKLSNLFMAARAPVVKWMGRDVYSMYEYAASQQELKCRLKFMSYTTERPQGLYVRSVGGRMMLDGVEEERMRIWPKYQGHEVEIEVRATSGNNLSIRIWNVWEDEHRQVDSWTGNSGMLVENESNERFIVKCSDGVGDVAFEDLIVSVALEL